MQTRFTIIDRQSELLPAIMFERYKRKLAKQDREKLRYSEIAGYWIDARTGR